MIWSTLFFDQLQLVCLRNPPILLVRHLTAIHLTGRPRLSFVSEVKEDSLKVALAAFSMHVLQVTNCFFSGYPPLPS